MPQFEFTLNLNVHSPTTLYEQALKVALAEHPSRLEANKRLRPYGVINLEACLVELLDPGSLVGCEINESSCERVPI
jgi:hypothetical protein